MGIMKPVSGAARTGLAVSCGRKEVDKAPLLRARFASSKFKIEKRAEKILSWEMKNDMSTHKLKGFYLCCYAKTRAVCNQMILWGLLNKGKVN